MLFYLKRSFTILTPSIFFPLYKTFIRPHLEYAFQATHSIICRDAEAVEEVQKLALKFVKGLRHIPYEAALKQLCIYSLTPANPWGPNSHVQDYPWSPGIPHGIYLRLSNPPRATRPRIQVPPTAMLYAPSPIRLHHSGCPILEQIAG